MFRRRPELTSSQIIFFGFLGVILIGTLLLMLPIATRDRQGASFADALFTVTSATCVTGLVVKDTVTYWSLFGQVILMLLLQIGGMGIVTASLAVFLFSGKRISLRQRSTMQESISAAQVGGIVRLTGFILKTSILLELLGAAFLTRLRSDGTSGTVFFPVLVCGKPGDQRHDHASYRHRRPWLFCLG